MAVVTTRWLLVLAAFLLGACSQQDFINKITTPEDRANAVSFVEALRSGDQAALEARMAPQAWQSSKTTLPLARGVFPTGKLNWEVTGANVHTTVTGSQSSTVKQLMLQAGSGGRWVVAEVVTLETNAKPLVMQWRVTPVAGDPRTLNGFGLAGKSPVHYFWLVMMIVVPAICVTAVVSIWRGPSFPNRWVWTIGCLFGFVSFSLNWATGQIGVRPISFQILGASVLKPGVYTPWIATFSVPVVALIYLLWQRRRRAADVDAPG